jgi:TPR repeat protein
MKSLVHSSLLLLLAIGFACTQKPAEGEDRSMNQPEGSLEELTNCALENGDTAAFRELEIAYLDFPQGAFLPIALAMADRHPFAPADFSVYRSLLKPTRRPGQNLSLDSCSAVDKERALRYLNKSAQAGYAPAIHELKSLSGGELKKLQ